MKALVQIRGCNGSGKSTIPMSMLDDPDVSVVSMNKQNGKAPYITLFPTYGWIALGKYDTSCGGMDGYKNNADTKMVLDRVLAEYPRYDILMEGVIASTVYSTWLNWFKEFEEAFNGSLPKRQIIILNLLPPVQVCLDRIQVRNGGKPIDEKAVESKWRTVERNHYKFLEEGFTSIRLNTAKAKKKQMLGKFIETVNNNR